MILFQIILLIVLNTFTKATDLAQLAFVSSENMKSHQMIIIKNSTVKNEAPNESTLDCYYIKDWQAKYHFHGKQHPYIYYFVTQCLDELFQVIRSDVKFNYDGSQDLLELPEGCIAPHIDQPKDNPCEDGQKLGDNILQNATQLLIWKMVFHAEQLSEQEDDLNVPNIDTDDLNQVLFGLKDIQDIILNVVRESRIVYPSEKSENGEHSKFQYVFADGSTGHKTVDWGLKKSVLEVTDSNGSTKKRTDNGDGTSEIVYKDSQGNIQYIETIKLSLDDTSKEEVTLYSAENEPISPSFIRTSQPDSFLVDFSIPKEILTPFISTVKFLIKTIRDHLIQKLNCFAESIIDTENNYLIFVCINTVKNNTDFYITKLFLEAITCGKLAECSQKASSVFSFLHRKLIFELSS
jgi:hypothetical protein